MVTPLIERARGPFPKYDASSWEIETLMHGARTSDTDGLLDFIQNRGGVMPDIAEATVDEDTKDTALHVIANNALVEVFAAIRTQGVVSGQMGRPTPPSPWPSLCTRQNALGNTVLHAAVLSGDIYMTKAVVHGFNEGKIEVPGNPRYPPPSPSEEEGPLEYEEYHLPLKTFVNTVNEAGRDALAEARAHDYSDIAAWLEGYMERVGIRLNDGPQNGYSWEEWHNLKETEAKVGKIDISINK